MERAVVDGDGLLPTAPKQTRGRGNKSTSLLLLLDLNTIAIKLDPPPPSASKRRDTHREMSAKQKYDTSAAPQIKVHVNELEIKQVARSRSNHSTK